MANVDEYLERLFAEGLRREIDSDEAVWRTLPFFATTIGITGTVVGYNAAQLPLLAWNLHLASAYIPFAIACVSLCASFAWLFIAFRPRTYRYPPAETDIQRLAIEYTAYHAALEQVGASLDAAVVSSLRTIMVEEYALAAVQNRGHNRHRLFARSQAIFFLMIGLAISFVSGAFSFVEQRIAVPTATRFTGASLDRRGPAYRSGGIVCIRADTASASAAPTGFGRHPPVCSPSEDTATIVTTSDAPKSSIVTSPEPQPGPEPRRPQPVLMKKSNDPSRPLDKK